MVYLLLMIASEYCSVAGLFLNYMVPLWNMRLWKISGLCGVQNYIIYFIIRIWHWQQLHWDVILVETIHLKFIQQLLEEFYIYKTLLNYYYLCLTTQCVTFTSNKMSWCLLCHFEIHSFSIYGALWFVGVFLLFVSVSLLIFCFCYVMWTVSLLNLLLFYARLMPAM